MAKDLLVRIIGDSSSLNRSIDAAEGKTRGLASRFGGLAKASALAAGAAGLGALVVGLKDSVSAGIAAEEAQGKLNVAFRNLGVSAKTMAAPVSALEAAQRKLGFANKDTRESLTKFVTAGENVVTATKDMAVASDLARLKNISLGDATTALIKIHAGNARALKELGIVLPPVTKAQDALKAANVDTTTALGKHELALAKVEDKLATGAAAAKVLADRVKGQGEEFSNTAAGGLARMHAQLQAVEERIGQKLLPVIVALANKLDELITWISTNWPKFQTIMEPVLKIVAVLIENVIAKIKAIVTTISGVIDLIKAIKDGRWSEVWGDIKKIVIDGVGGMLLAMLTLPEKILLALGKKAWAGLSAIGGYIKDAILSGLSAIGSGVLGFITGAINDAISLLNHAIDLYNAIPLLPNIGHVGAVGTGGPPAGQQSSTGKFIGPRAKPRAFGGPVTVGGSYVVGEHGPELFVPGRNGTIIPAGGGSGGLTVNVAVPGTLVGSNGMQEFARILRDELLRMRRSNPSLGLA